MLQEDRFVRIQSLLDSFSRVTTEHFIQDMQVSRETVRQDLLALEALGLLRRVHGGAAKVAQDEPPFVHRQNTRVREKTAIAKTAVKLLSPGQLLFIDAGTTTAILAQELSLLSGLTIITNSIPIATTLSATQHHNRVANHVVLLGGQVNTEVQCTYGEATLNALHQYHADVALISPVGITAAVGCSSFDAHEFHIAQAMARHADKLVVLADHSKVGVQSRYVSASSQNIHTLVTNAHAKNTEALEQLAQTPIDIKLA
ncbi:DeoR/GlpR transcriptional regulator [Lampropedia puyangensis]|uniref:DeoR/GlpR transcriptional regulator n=1 Tax=Lampropedia puyangensis TaxID=1330072 RepID=A0A4S8F1E4_9BURK|nr:DeoR/GlpR family DNA-binding transcription regulator [Lampropedia puyangensis]THU01080.1 DeoR/GlpR transcriptional regulator [Lampropedia puyangensis]